MNKWIAGIIIAGFGVSNLALAMDLPTSDQPLKNTYKASLDLSHQSLDPLALESVLQLLGSNPNFGAIHMDSGTLNEEGMRLLGTFLQSNASLTTLTLSHVTGLGDSTAIYLANAFAKNTCLTSVDLSRNKMSDEAFEAFSKSMKINKRIKIFNLQGNNSGAKGVISLADALCENETLTDLNLAYSFYGDSGLTAMALMLKINTSLDTLNLEGNGSGKQGYSDLAGCLKYNETLKKLNLSENPNPPEFHIEDQYADIIKNNSSIVDLSLGLSLDLSTSLMPITEALKSNKSLERISLNGSSINDSGAALLAGVLKGNTTIHYLDLNSNNIGDMGAQYLADGLQNNTSLYMLTLVNNQMTVKGRDILRQLCLKNSWLCVDFGNRL